MIQIVGGSSSNPRIVPASRRDHRNSKGSRCRGLWNKNDEKPYERQEGFLIFCSSKIKRQITQIISDMVRAVIQSKLNMFAFDF